MKSLEKLIRRYAEAAATHGDEKNPTRRRNRAADRILDCLRTLRAEPDRGLSALRRLASHENPGVRGWAATHLLSLDNELAVRTKLELLESAPRGSFLRASTSFCLQLWRDGRLKILDELVPYDGSIDHVDLDAKVGVARESISDEAELSEGGSRIERHQPPDEGFVPPAEPLPGAHEAIVAYFQDRFGEVSSVYHEIISHYVHIDVNLIPATGDRDHHVLFTTGMSDRPMKRPEGVEAPSRTELMLALPRDWPLGQEHWDDERNYFPIGVLKMLARLPHEYRTFLGCGHTIPNGDPPKPYAPNTRLCCALVTEPSRLLADDGAIEIPGGEVVRIHAVSFLHDGESRLKLQRGIDALIDRFDGEVPLVLDVDRPDVTGPRKRFGRR